MAGYLRLIVMKTLANRKLSGYDLIKQIEKNAGTWKPSFGSIYPLLDKLLKEKLVEVEESGRKKLYHLTTEGRKHLELINKNKDKFIGRMIAMCNAFGRITDKGDKGFMLEILGSLKKGRLPFKEISPELNEFRAAVFEVYSSGKERKKIKSVLRAAAGKLRKIK